MESFHIMFVKTISSQVDRHMFEVAIRDFNNEYTPASWVEITEVEHMSTTYDPKRKEFTHSFSVSWNDPKQ